MKKSFRIVCFTLAIAFAATILLSIIFSVALADEADSRGETVYVETDAQGKVLSVISSVYLTNSAAAETVTDSTTLKNIKNVLGSEAPEINGTSVTFKAEGEDVCYQGEAEGDLPLELELSYFMDGERIAAEAIAGMSGRARIEIKCKNKLMRTALIDGAEEKLYVPFSVIGLITLDAGCTGLDSDAKISSQAGVTTVMAIMLPGLAESLSLESNDKIKDSFYIEFDTRGFELAQCTFIGITGIVSESDLAGIDDVSELFNALDQINSASGQLYSGAKRLRNGADTLSAGIEQYIAGVSAAAAGTHEIAQGSEQLKDGALEVSHGMSTFSSGINEIIAKVDEAKAKLDELQNPSSDIDARIIAAVEAAANEALAGKEEEIKAAVRQSVYDALSGTSLSDEEKAAIAAAAAAAVNVGDITISVDPETANAIRMAIIELDDVKTAISGLNSIIAQADEMGAGADQLASGMHEVSSAISKLSRGLDELDEGMALLDENGAQLAQGTKQLYRGLDSLTDGLKQLSVEGLGKIIEETGEIQISLSRKDALLELSESYKAFSSDRQDINGSVQFVITTSAIVEPLPIEMPQPTPAEAGNEGSGTVDAEIVEKGQTIWDWFAQIFAAIKGVFA